VSAGRDLVHDGQLDRILGCGRSVRSHDRVSVDRRVVERRYLLGRHHVVCEDEPFGVGEVDVDRSERFAAGQHTSLGVFERRHVCTVPSLGLPRQTGKVSAHQPFPADGYTASWEGWDTAHREVLTLTWDNEGWTASGHVDRHAVQYVIRLSPLWQVRQFLLFRDLDEPDLWLGTDGHGRWGEVNGAHRVDLDGGIDIALACTPFTHAIPIRRLQLDVGDRSSTVLLDVDVETLGVVTAGATYARLAADRYEVQRADAIDTVEVDEYGLPVDIADQFRRV